MPITRRDFLAASAAGVCLGGAAGFSIAATAGPRSRSLRIAHLTDIHLQPELQAARGLAACFSHLQTRPVAEGHAGHDAAPPDLIITGGDTIMDSFEADTARTKLQWELWRKVKADHCGMELHSVVGNHDVWGWSKGKSGTTGSEPQYGKRWVCDEFGRELPYTSFDRAGWHVVLLDSIFPHQQSYIGRIDDAQWDWLERDLAAVPVTTPIILFTHIPILSAVPFTLVSPAMPAMPADATPAMPVMPADAKPAFTVHGGHVHVDVDRFAKLFQKHRHVKACASGHLHMVEQIDFGGVRYLCNGAVSGGWWKGRNRDTDFGYAVVDLFDDGTVERRYVPYGWTAAT